MEASSRVDGTAVPTVAPSRNAIVAALVALLVGGAIATGIWWLTDNDVDILPEPATTTKVIVSPSVEPGAGTAVKNEAAVAAVIGSSQLPASRTDTNAPTSSLSGLPPAAQYDVNPSSGQATPRYDGGPEEGTAQVHVGSGARQHGE
jgi:hypothetical protein